MQRNYGSALSQKTVAFLRERITSGEWPVNSRIPIEPELQNMLGVGKTTVREAVRSLANLGMLETLPGRGTFVRSRTPVSSLLTDYISEFPLADILGYRRALEIEAAQLAASNRTQEQLDRLQSAFERDHDVADEHHVVERGTTPGSFHFIIFESSGNALMTGLYAGITAALRRAIDAGEIIEGATHSLRHKDHSTILTGIESQDVAKAAHAMALHVDRDLVQEGSIEVGNETPRIHRLLTAGLGHPGP